MVITVLILTALALIPFVTIAKGFVVMFQEKSMEKAQQLKQMLNRVVLSARHAKEVKEAALLYGIDSNEAGVDTVELLEHRESLVEYFGKKEYNNVCKKITSGLCPFPDYDTVVETRHRVNHKIDLTGLIVVVMFHSIHVVKTGGDGDGEAAARSLQARLRACAA